MTSMPPDPFGSAGDPGNTEFAANSFSMFTALLASGFTEAQALRFLAELMSAMICNQAGNVKKEAGPGNS